MSHTYRSLKDFGKAFDIVKLGAKLEKVSKKTTVGRCIHIAIRSGELDKDMIYDIKTWANIDRKEVSTALGEPLLLEIENIKL